MLKVKTKLTIIKVSFNAKFCYQCKREYTFWVLFLVFLFLCEGHLRFSAVPGVQHLFQELYTVRLEDAWLAIRLEELTSNLVYLSHSAGSILPLLEEISHPTRRKCIHQKKKKNQHHGSIIWRPPTLLKYISKNPSHEICKLHIACVTNTLVGKMREHPCCFICG